MANILSLNHVSKSYPQGDGAVEALHPTTINIAEGEVVALVGTSGSGKSTLLHIAGLLLQPTQGSIMLEGQACEQLDDKAATLLRRGSLGFVYQFHHLLPELTAYENVAVPLMLQGVAKKEQSERIHAMLENVGLSERAHHLPSELSGGQAQRVAIARALIHQPTLLLADEPTGNLDPDTAEQVESLMIDTIKRHNAAALIATHNMAMAERMDRVITL